MQKVRAALGDAVDYRRVEVVGPRVSSELLAYGMLGREEDARDATQETFLAAFRNLRGFRGEAKVSSWLHRIAVNQCITRQRRAKVRGDACSRASARSGGGVIQCVRIKRVTGQN